jgi:hypothetical protein
LTAEKQKQKEEEEEEGGLRTISLMEVGEHGDPDDAWMVIYDKVHYIVLFLHMNGILNPQTREKTSFAIGKQRVKTARQMDIVYPGPGSLDKIERSRFNLSSIFCHSAFFVFVIQRWNLFLMREKCGRKFQY